MRTPHADGWTRRRFLGGLTVAGAAGLLGLPPRPVAAEPPPETTEIRLIQFTSACQAPLYIRQHPVATKRAMRAILKAADICAVEPDRAAQFFVDKGYTARYDYARQAMQELPYGKWREYDHEDTVRFYALRLHEAGMIKSTPSRSSPRAPTGASSPSSSGSSRGKHPQHERLLPRITCCVFLGPLMAVVPRTPHML